jgi:hypothetical protein
MGSLLYVINSKDLYCALLFVKAVETWDKVWAFGENRVPKHKFLNTLMKDCHIKFFRGLLNNSFVVLRFPLALYLPNAVDRVNFLYVIRTRESFFYFRFSYTASCTSQT